MPRLIDPTLLQALERANPNVCHVVEIRQPDVEQVLQRAVDQFLSAPPLVSQTPANSITADPAGSLTINSATASLGAFPFLDDFDTTTIPRNALSAASFRALCWLVDPAFRRTVLTQVTAQVRRADVFQTSNLALQIYRRTATNGAIAFVPLLANPVVWQSTPAKWFGRIPHLDQPLFANVDFDLSDLHVELGRTNAPPIFPEIPGLIPDAYGEEQAYYFAIEAPDARSDDVFWWSRDRTTSATIANVGIFLDRNWQQITNNPAQPWVLDTTIPPAVPTCTLTVQSYLASAQAIYALTLPALPQAESVGQIVFEAGVPPGTTAALELSTAGSGGPWTAVADGDALTARQLTVHGRVTLTADSTQTLAPTVAALGITWGTLVDVTAESVVTPISAEISVPFCESAIGEGTIDVVRTGIRDYHDLGADLAAAGGTSRLEANVYLGSRHPAVTRDAWLRVDRALMNDRAPGPTAEQFGLVSYLKTLMQKVPVLVESVNAVRTVTSATTSAVHVTPAIPLVGGGSYANLGYYMRVRSSSQPNIETGYVQTIDDSTGTGTLDFLAPLPGTLIAGDIIEIHSAQYNQAGLSFSDADPADVWLQLLNVHCGIPLDRIGAAGYGSVGRGGYPPSVADRAPGDLVTQAKLRVTLATTEQEDADKLVDQISFVLGGATVEIAGQIVFRQIYPLRDPTGQIVVPAEPIAATFDITNTYNLSTPSAVEQRIVQLSCNFGVNTTAVSTDAQASLTTNFVDVDAIAALDTQPIDQLAPTAIADEIARWCYNSADQGAYLAGMLTQQVVRACSTGVRVWSWGATELFPQLVIGDRVAVVTDQYTDYDPSRQLAIRGTFAYTLVIVSVQGGGSQFRGYMLGLSDAVQLKGGPGTRATDTTDKTDVLSVTYTDSADGTTRTYVVIGGAAVERLYVHHRAWPVGTEGNPFDFTQEQTLTDDPQLIIVAPDPVDGKFRVTLSFPPRGEQVKILMVPRQAPPSLAWGTGVWKDTLDPADSLLTAKIHLAVTGAAADLSIAVVVGVSDVPVEVDVYEGTPSGTPLLTTTLMTSMVLDKTNFPRLGARALPPGKDTLAWWALLTNVAGDEAWAGPASANRDPLANGSVTVGNYRDDPDVVLAFDPDTDAIALTISDGRTKTWNRAALDAATSPVQYLVGTTLLDDGSTEEAFAVGESRTGYQAVYTGGGTSTLIWGPATLHGQPPNPPTALITTAPNTAGNAESISVTVDTQVQEQLHVYYRQGDDDLAPVYVACVGATDRTVKAFPAGHTVGPADYFCDVDGSGAPSLILAAITLTRGQIKRHGIMIEGADSGLQSPWLPVVLSLMAHPELTSFAAEWDQATGAVVARAKGGFSCASVLFELSDSSAFASPITDSAALADGADVTKSEALAGAQRGKLWYVGATPFNAAALGGISGVRSVVQVIVPAIIGALTVAVTESAGIATITVTIDDPGAVLNAAWTDGTITGALSFNFLKLGTASTEAATTHTLVGTLNTWTKTVTLDPLHVINVSLVDHFLDGSQAIIWSSALDSNKLANVVTASVANHATIATTSINWDPDTETGAACMEFSLNNGVSWTAEAVSALGLSQYDVTRTSVKQTMLVHGKNAVGGAWGPSYTIEIDSYEAPGGSSPQGTVSVDTNGVLDFSVDGGPGVLVYQWLASTSAYPSDGATVASGAFTTGGSFVTILAALTLTFGQVGYITLVPYDLSTTALPSIHLRGAYQSYTATKFANFAPGSLIEAQNPSLGSSRDSDGNLLCGSSAGGGTQEFDTTVLLPAGTTGVLLTSISVDMWFPSVVGGATGVGFFFNRRSTGGGATSLATGSASSGLGWQTLTASLSENTVGNSYQLGAQFAVHTGSAGGAGIGQFVVGYTMGDPKQTL